MFTVTDDGVLLDFQSMYLLDCDVGTFNIFACFAYRFTFNISSMESSIRGTCL